jgi:hypothetical protein
MVILRKAYGTLWNQYMILLGFEQPMAFFLRIPKTGSTSIIRSLFGGIEQATLKLRSQGPDLILSERFYFSFIRNPIDRFRSGLVMFRHYKSDPPLDEVIGKKLSVETACRIATDPAIDPFGTDVLSKCKLHLMPYTSGPFDILACDFIGTTCRFARDFRHICRHLGLETVDQIPHYRSQEYCRDGTTFSPWEAEMIRRTYADDQILFNHVIRCRSEEESTQ